MCRSKHVEPSINFGIINSITKLHLVDTSTESCYDARIHEYQICIFLFQAYRLARAPPSLLFNAYRFLSLRYNDRGVKLTTHLYLLLRLRMNGAKLLLILYASPRGQPYLDNLYLLCFTSFTTSDYRFQYRCYT